MKNGELENRLIDIKMILEHGITHMNDMCRIGRMLAIHHAHQAVELTLRIRAEQIGSNAYHYPDLIKDLKKTRPGVPEIAIPNERTLGQLNSARVSAQHYGDPQDLETTMKLVSIAKEAVIDFWLKEFGKEYDDISMLNLLQDKDIRETLRKAESFLKEKKYDESIELSMLAIYQNIWRLGKEFPPPAFETKGSLLNELSGFGSSNPFERWDDFLHVVLSVPYASKLKQLREKTGIVYVHIPYGKPNLQRMKDYKAAEPDAFLAYSLAMEYSLWIEQTYF